MIFWKTKKPIVEPAPVERSEKFVAVHREQTGPYGDSLYKTLEGESLEEIAKKLAKSYDAAGYRIYRCEEVHIQIQVSLTEAP